MHRHPEIVLAMTAAASLFGQDFIIANSGEPQSLDPAQIQGFTESRLNLALFEGLMAPNPKTAKSEPGLAQSWKVSGAGKVYTFKLRKANWSDGTPITAQQVADSWLRTLDPATGSQYASLPADMIEGAAAYNAGKGRREDVKIKALDGETVQVTFVGPMPYVIDALSLPPFAVVPMHVIAKYGKDWIKPGHFVGNGPFVLKDWRPQDHITVVRNPNYWDARNVKLKSITFLPLENAAVAYDKYKAGEIDWTPDIDPARIEEVKLRRDFQHSPGSTVFYFKYNVTRKPFDDVRVRKAFSMALDRKELTDQVLKGGEIPTAGLVPPFGGFHTAVGNPYNPAQARKLLAAAGFPGGAKFPKFTFLYNTNAQYKKIVEWAQFQWKKVLGVEVGLQNLEWNTFVDTNQKAHNFYMCRGGWGADYPDPQNFLEILLKTGSPINAGLYSNPAFDALLDKGNELPGGPARDQVYMKAESIAITRDQALCPIFFSANEHLIDLSKWGGWYPNSIDLHPWKYIYKK